MQQAPELLSEEEPKSKGQRPVTWLLESRQVALVQASQSSSSLETVEGNRTAGRLISPSPPALLLCCHVLLEQNRRPQRRTQALYATAPLLGWTPSRLKMSSGSSTTRGQGNQDSQQRPTVLNTMFTKSAEWHPIDHVPCTIRLLKGHEGSLDFYEFDEDDTFGAGRARQLEAEGRELPFDSESTGLRPAYSSLRTFDLSDGLP